jgi:hypothetical protein
MRSCLAGLLAVAAVLAAASPAVGQADPYQPPLYWSVYENHILKEQAGVQDNYISEDELQADVDWVGANLEPYGYTMIAMDGWGDVSQLSEHGYRASHSSHWTHDFAWWSAYLQSRGLKLGMYGDPLWIHVPLSDTTTKIVGTNIPVSSLIDPGEQAAFTWVQVDRPGAEQYVKGCIAYYADMGIDYFRVDFLSWYETGYDRNLGTVGPSRPHEDYVTALRWMREASDSLGVYLSLVMPNLFNEAEVERQYGRMFRIDSDTGSGGWWQFSDQDRGHRFAEWSQYANAMDGLTYWSYLSGRNLVRLDGDFIRLNTFATNSEKRTVVSAHVLAGGPVAVGDQPSTIGGDVWLYQNTELLALHDDGFVGHPLTHDPTDESSQIWTGELTNGDRVVGLFNRESGVRTRSLAFGELGYAGVASVRDLWQHASLGTMDSISVDLPPHGSMVLELTDAPAACTPQSITFDPIADRVYGDPPFTPSASASSGLPVSFEVALGPAEVAGNQVALTGGNGTVYVVAKQPGDGATCAAIPRVRSFTVTGGHQPAMYLAGTFTGWAPNIPMTLDGDAWVADSVVIGAGAQEMKFADTPDWSGDDWGDGDGLTGTVTLTTGGGPNTRFTSLGLGYYRVTFNDITLQYAVQKIAGLHQPAMYVAGTFTGWNPNIPMTLVGGVWTALGVPLDAGSYELKFANTTDWTGDDWGDATGISGTVTLTTGGGPNVSFTVPDSGAYDIRFDDLNLVYEIVVSGSATGVGGTPPHRTALLGSFPNPAGPVTHIEYELTARSRVEIVVFDVQGRQVATAVDEEQPPGRHVVRLETAGLPGGTYFCRLKAGSFEQSHRLIIIH